MITNNDSTYMADFVPQPKLRATKRLSLKKVPRAPFRQLNRLYKRHRTIQFRIENNDYAIQLIPLDQYQVNQQKNCVQIDKRFLFHLSLDLEFCRKVLNDYPDMGNLTTMPALLKEIAMEVAVERLLDRFDQHLNCKSSIIPVSDTRWSDYMKYNLCFKIIKKTDHTKYYGSIKTNRNGINWMIKQLDRLPAINLKKAGQIPLDIFFETGRAILSSKELKAIELNDIILIDSDYSLSNPPIIIRTGPLAAFYGRIDQNEKIRIEEKLIENMEGKMEEIQTANQTIPEGKLDKQIDDIPVKLVFQLGESRMKLGELIQLQPGYIFEIAADIKNPVTIKANGLPVGTGELVQIGDRVGVRVLEFKDD